MVKKRGRGRLPKKAVDKQSERVIAYVTPDDARKMRADAAGQGMTPSAFITGLWREWRSSREG